MQYVSAYSDLESKGEGGEMLKFASGALFLAFLINVVAGAFGYGQFLGDVGEMLLLFAASLSFVVITLNKEAKDKTDNQ